MKNLFGNILLSAVIIFLAFQSNIAFEKDVKKRTDFSEIKKQFESENIEDLRKFVLNNDRRLKILKKENSIENTSQQDIYQSDFEKLVETLHNQTKAFELIYNSNLSRHFEALQQQPEESEQLNSKNNMLQSHADFLELLWSTR